MKDTQVAPPNAEPRIFLISAILHCISMTVLVYLRSSFGYGYLRPKSVFIAFSWAFALYAIYGWIDGDVWREHRAIIWFGVGSVVLYSFSLISVVRREWRGTAEHDNYAGKPHLESLVHSQSKIPSEILDKRLRLWGEPAITGLAALLTYIIGGEFRLSGWLILAAFCLWTKEALNQWFHLRQGKRVKDIAADAAEAFAEHSTDNASMPQPPKADARKSKIRRDRACRSTIDDE